MRRGSGCLLYEKTYMPAEGWQVWFHVKKWRIALRMKEMTLNINSLYMYMYCFTNECIHTHAHTCKQTRSMGYTHTHTQSHSHTCSNFLNAWMADREAPARRKKRKKKRKTKRRTNEPRHRRHCTYTCWYHTHITVLIAYSYIYF